MAIPDYQTLMYPVLKIAGDGKSHKLRDAVEKISDDFGLTEDERQELLPSGSTFTISSRVSWARTYLKQALLLETPKRGHFKITTRGKDLLDSGISNINNTTLDQFKEFRDFKTRRKNQDSAEGKNASSSTSSALSPEDELAEAYSIIRKSIESELLDCVMDSSPAFFEQLVVDLVVRMGYGGSVADAGKAIGKSGDGGIDGIIKEDQLGLDLIYLQAKRWEGVVGSPEIQKFAGALQGKRARKGIFITTSVFSKQAREFVDNIEASISLIDGKMFTKLMFDHSVGLSHAGSYELKKIDSDYFVEI